VAERATRKKAKASGVGTSAVDLSNMMLFVIGGHVEDVETMTKMLTADVQGGDVWLLPDLGSIPFPVETPPVIADPQVGASATGCFENVSDLSI
jgi:hypothetical protein